jgi:hypothetical protein
MHSTNTSFLGPQASRLHSIASGAIAPLRARRPRSNDSAVSFQSDSLKL